MQMTVLLCVLQKCERRSYCEYYSKKIRGKRSSRADTDLE